MKLSRFIFLSAAIFFVFGAVHARAQVADSADVDTMAIDSTLIDTTLFVKVAPDTSLTADSVKDLFKVVPWKYHAPVESEIAASDSTLRWQIWPNWTHKKVRDPGVIGYRLGTVGRTSSFLIDAHEPRYQQLLWEDVSMNDPVSGIANWDFIPLNKVNRLYEEEQGLNHVSTYFLRQYYLTQPLTKLIYSESKFDFRNLEFLASQNFSQKTNVEISYWDRRGGDEYSNSQAAGRQIFARVFHQLDHRQSLKVHFLNNKFTTGEPFGYIISDLNNFAFDRFTTTANQPSAESEVKATNVSLNYYRRGADTTKTTDDFHAGLFLSSRERSLDYSIDSTFYKVQTIGANARKWVDLDPLRLEGGLSYELFINRNGGESSVHTGNWGLFKSEAKASFSPLGFITLSGGARYRSRSDGFNDGSFNGEADISVADVIHLKAGASSGTIMPTPQQLYWQSDEHQGNTGLSNEELLEYRGEVSLNIFKSFTVGVKGQIKDIKNGIMFRQDSVFTPAFTKLFRNVAPYNSASVTGYMDFNNKFFELSGSATIHRYGHFIGSSSGPLPVDDSKRVWLKGSAYVKGYVFNRAAFLKAGLSGMISPLRYRAGHYDPVLDYWQPLSDDQFLPVFNRLDADVSARIRTIMITLRWENVLDDVAQLGYFETAGYPMPQRRFMFGINVFFRN